MKSFIKVQILTFLNLSLVLLMITSCSEDTPEITSQTPVKELMSDLNNKSMRLASQISTNQHFLTMLSLSDELAEMPINYANSLPTSQRVSFTNSVNALNSSSSKSILLSTMGYNTLIFNQKMDLLKTETLSLANDIPTINQLTKLQLIVVLGEAENLSRNSTQSWICEIEHSVCQTSAFFEVATEFVVCAYENPTLGCYGQAAYDYLINTANCIGNWAECEGWV
jgi:hypothetical protein